MEKKTSEEWQETDKHKNLIIHDADGWRDGCNFYKDKITEKEFERRKMFCTVMWKNERNGKIFQQEVYKNKGLKS